MRFPRLRLFFVIFLFLLFLLLLCVITISARGEGENESSRRIKTEFLVQMQGVGKAETGVLVLGATNTPWDLDPAIRRRFEKRVYIPLPDIRGRQALFRSSIGSTPNHLTEDDYYMLAEATEGYSGADISILVRDALYEPVRICQIATHYKKVPDTNPDAAQRQPFLYEPCSPGDPAAIEMTLYDIPGNALKPVDVNIRHFEHAIQSTKPSVGPGDLTRFEEWTAQFGQEGSG